MRNSWDSDFHQHDAHVAAYIERALDFGTHKIDCIKVIRSYFDYGLKEAKDLSEAGPNTLVSRESNKAYAQEFVKAIQKVGGAAHITEEITHV